MIGQRISKHDRPAHLNEIGQVRALGRPASIIPAGVIFACVHFPWTKRFRRRTILSRR
jgi:hypothetical protein